MNTKNFAKFCLSVAVSPQFSYELAKAPETVLTSIGLSEEEAKHVIHELKKSPDFGSEPPKPSPDSGCIIPIG